MPMVTIQVTGDPVTKAQSEELIRRSTGMIEDVLGKDPEITWVVIEEVPTTHWGVGGDSFANQAAKAQAAKAQ